MSSMKDKGNTLFPSRCLQPDAMDSACKCCQRWFHALDRQRTSMSTELDALRAEQAARVMPLIGPLLDAWEGLPNDVRGEVEDLAEHLTAIESAMALDDQGNVTCNVSAANAEGAMAWAKARLYPYVLREAGPQPVPMERIAELVAQALDKDAQEIKKWRDAYENMRDFAVSRGLDVTCYGDHASPGVGTAPLDAAMDNMLAWRLGEIALDSGDPRRKGVGDRIDRGLILLRLLNEAGFSVRQEREGRKTMNDEKVLVALEDAVKRLPDGDLVHTFRQAGPCLVGAHWDRTGLIEAMRKAPTIEETGPEAQAMHHGLAIKDENGWLFIETRKL